MKHGTGSEMHKSSYLKLVFFIKQGQTYLQFSLAKIHHCSNLGCKFIRDTWPCHCYCAICYRGVISAEGCDWGQGELLKADSPPQSHKDCKSPIFPFMLLYINIFNVGLVFQSLGKRLSLSLVRSSSKTRCFDKMLADTVKESEFCSCSTQLSSLMI